MKRYTYRATIAYDGSGFAGYAVQRGLRTVEGTLLTALRPLVPEIPAVQCGGRTDRGVHATAQVISFWSRQRFPCEALAQALDAAAPGEIAVRDLSEAPRAFHATFSAKSRHYVYLLDDAGDVERMDAMLDALVGTRCFSVFARDTPRGPATVKRLFEARARAWGQGARFDFRASGFLKRQVRVMVATAHAEAQRGSPADALLRIAESGDRWQSARPVAPGGLHLAAVTY
jgi:tRNA pseudouridine38-40 synthase